MILFRYLAKEIFISMLAVSSVLLLIVMSSRFVKYLAEAASGDLAPEVVLSIMAYRLPSFLELVLPLGLFIAILLSYGRLYVESEMTVMSSCGVSTRRLALYTLVPALMVAALVAYLSMVASPVGIAKVQDVFDDAKNSSGLETLVAGRFRVDIRSGRVSYIEKLTGDRRMMKEVFSAQQSRGKGGNIDLTVIFAEQGEIRTNKEQNARYLVLDNGYRYIGQPGGLDFQITHFQHYGQLVKEPKERSNSYKKTDARSTQWLLQSDRLEDKATLQWRISLAVLVPIIALIALALSKTDHRRGRYVKMLPAFIIYIVYLISLSAARNGIENEKLSVDWGMWWVHFLFLAFALLLLFGADWLRLIKARRLR